MVKRFDVIIVGLGPAGAAAAVELCHAGAEVLVLNQPQTRGKSCGGCLSLRGLRSLDFLNPPAWVSAHPVSRLWIGSPGRSPAEYVSDSPGAYFVERGRLDDFLAQRALEAGAVVLPRRARQVQTGPGGFVVRGSDESWTGDWLLGAGGTSCLVKRRLGLGRTSWAFAALVEERPMPASHQPFLEDAALLELGGAAGGYAWAFGRGQVLNLGVAGLTKRDQGVPGGLHQRYQKFLTRLGLKPGASPRGAAIPCPDRRRPRLVKGRAAVIGDAGGLADPVLGEGIAQAVVSGRMAGAAIAAGDLGLYQHRMEQTLLKDHHHARILARLIYRTPRLFHALAQHKRGGVELGFNWLRGELAPGDIWLALASSLAGRPPRLDPNRCPYYISGLN